MVGLTFLVLFCCCRATSVSTVSNFIYILSSITFYLISDLPNIASVTYLILNLYTIDEDVLRRPSVHYLVETIWVS